MSALTPNRRDLLTGRALRDRAVAAQEALAAAAIDEVSTAAPVPRAGSTVRLSLRAMATDFGVLLNPGVASQTRAASQALEVVGPIERQLTVYRDDSEVSRLNATAGAGPCAVTQSLSELLQQCHTLNQLTDGAFDVAAQAPITLWHRCKAEGRLPDEDEIATALACSGMRHVRLDPGERTVAFDRPGVGLNFGAIGKGYALDQCAALLDNVTGQPVAATVEAAVDGDTDGEVARSTDRHSPGETVGRVGEIGREGTTAPSFCLFGGHSSILARGGHNGLPGWPVGIGNPLFTSRRLGTVLLTDRALGTSGSNIQFFRYGGQRYGHILDPRTARPAGELLSVSVFAPTAAMADALATAFFVLGVEKACAICDNLPSIGALLIPPPRRGGRLEPIAVGVPDDILFLDSDQVTVTRAG